MAGVVVPVCTGAVSVAVVGLTCPPPGMDGTGLCIGELCTACWVTDTCVLEGPEINAITKQLSRNIVANIVVAFCRKFAA